MACHQLAERIQQLQPEATPMEIARICLIIYNLVDDLSKLQDDEYLFDIWADINLKLQAATDQHQAVSEELNDLAKSDPKKFSPDQIWILVRAIKVQSQILRLYHNQEVFELS
ncbi:MAG TPA: hypothetical protein PKD64_16175 [Pirellulaceae bacterium]|mgnify:CR=1 FL=1|nr:hypothetical protein [Pirellulaceae bacterium]HMO93726.1 hypothetical protein [Pirellulaceae bacterium]HMP69771.1 hypothetical protein [Pirellulaceae bacterium]